MAKGKGEIKGWITKNGVHIPIYGTYTVRGGVEPKAKGSKFKRKKRPEEFDKDIRESGGKYWAAHSSAQGKKQGVKDLDKPFDTKEEARKFLAEENGEYEDAKFNKKTEAGQGDFAKHEDYTKNAEQKKKWQDISKALGDYDANDNKYADRDWNKDVDDSKRYGYSEQTEEGKKPVTKAEEEVRQSFRDKKAQEQGFADYESMKSYNEETGVNRESWQESSKVASNGAPRVSDEDAGHNKEVEWNGGKYQTQQVVDWDRNKNQEYVAGHLYVPVDPKNGEKQFFVANEDGSVHSSGSEYFRQKNSKAQESSTQSFSPESSAKAINDMARRRANGGGKDDDWKIANQTLESAPAGTTMIQTGDRGVKFQYTKGEDGKWHSSVGEDYTQDSKTLSMSWRYSSPSVEFTTLDKALSNEDIKASHDAATSGRLNQALGLDRNNRPIGNRSTRKVDTSTSKSYPWTKSTAEPAANELGRAYNEANKAKEKFTGMSVTALKSAYKNAVGSERGAIYQLLKAKGYRIVNGKWMKG